MWHKSILTLALGFTLLAPVEAQEWRTPSTRPKLPFPAGVEPRMPDGRQVWIYSAEGGGQFVGSRGLWTQYRADGTQARYREVARSADFVEIYDDYNLVALRLTNTSLYRNQGGQGWVPWFAGYWQ
jgi:hypothetical protein